MKNQRGESIAKFFFPISIIAMTNNTTAPDTTIPDAQALVLSIALEHVLTIVFELVPSDPIRNAFSTAGVEDISDVVTLDDNNIN